MKTTRRGFIRSVSMAVAGIGLAGTAGFSSLSLPESDMPEPEEKSPPQVTEEFVREFRKNLAHLSRQTRQGLYD